MGLVPFDGRSRATEQANAGMAVTRQAGSSPQRQRVCGPPSCPGVIGSNSFMADDLVLEKGLSRAGEDGRKRGSALHAVRLKCLTEG